MTNILTPWGYDVIVDDLESANGIPAIVSADEFSKITGGAYDGNQDDVRLILAAVSSAVRDYCGWHVSPVLKCEYRTEEADRLLWVPSMCIKSVDSVTYKGNALSLDDVEWKRCGVLRLSSIRGDQKWNDYVIDYTAGLDSGAAALKQIVSQIAVNALAAAPGIRSESAGQVSITYNTTGDGITGGISLLDRDKILLQPYRITNVR